MADRIRFRRGTAEQWLAADPVLAEGEPGLETDTGVLKLGNGVSTWTELPAFLDERSLTPHADDAEGGVAGSPTATGQVVSAKAAGAVGDGTTDDTAALQAAIDATATGGTCWIPPGEYLVSASAGYILRGRSGISIVGAGPRVTTLRVAADSGASRLLDLSKLLDVEVRGIGFVGGAAATRSAVYASGKGGEGLRVRNCRFENFMPNDATNTHAATYVWPTVNTVVSDNDYLNCGRGITLDQPEGPAEVSGNRIFATEARMATGILVRRASGVSETDIVVTGNRVEGARLDPSRIGAEGHGIAVYRCRDVQITSNHLEGNGRGILVSFQSFGALVQGNTCIANNDAGIRVEPEITSTIITIGSDAARGVSVIGNVCRDNAAIGTPTGANSGMGITISYAAGSTVSGNICHDNTADGIHCDSDRVSIVGNVCFNNWSGFSSDPTNGKRGGIRLYAGSGCTVVANQCFDNGVVKTQMYGLSMTSTLGHVVHGNMFIGNGVGEIFGADKIRESFFGAAPAARPASPGVATGPDAAVINRLITSLRSLGLVT